MIGRLTKGQMIAAVAAVVLLVAMFLPWIGVSGPSLPSGISLPPGVASAAGSSSENIWKGSTLDVYLLITVIVAALPALLAVTDASEEFSFVSAATFLLGVVGVILIAAFLTVDFPDGADRKYGAFIGLVSAVAIAFGGFRAMQEEVAGEI
jgi:hypothetical protein